ncbi:MAG: hypothetical protein ACR65Z_05765 [Methylocystis sp.]
MKFFMIFFFVISTALPAAAERGTSAQRAACTPDVFRLCASEIPDVNGIVSCLKREKAQLSQACRLVMVGDDKQKTATRSLEANGEWCDFAGEAVPVDEVWRAWCKAN